MIRTKLLSRDDLPKTAVGRRGRPRGEGFNNRRTVKHYTHSGGITTCTHCPPRTSMSAELRFCADCQRINRARFQAGLIKPPRDQRDHPNNIINPTVAGSYRGQPYHKRFTRSGGPCITASVEKLGSSWRRGVVTLNGAKIYIGPKTRSQDDAWDYANARAKVARAGLEFESLVADVNAL